MREVWRSYVLPKSMWWCFSVVWLVPWPTSNDIAKIDQFIYFSIRNKDNYIGIRRMITLSDREDINHNSNDMIIDASQKYVTIDTAMKKEPTNLIYCQYTQLTLSFLLLIDLAIIRLHIIDKLTESQFQLSSHQECTLHRLSVAIELHSKFTVLHEDSLILIKLQQKLFLPRCKQVFPT